MSPGRMYEEAEAPYPWKRLVLGGAVVLIAGIGCVAALTAYLGTLPSDMRRLSNTYAARVEGELRFGSIPLRDIRREPSVLHQNEDALWLESAFQARLPAGMRIDAAVEILRRSLEDGPLEVRAPGANLLGGQSEVICSLKGRTIARITIIPEEEAADSQAFAAPLPGGPAVENRGSQTEPTKELDSEASRQEPAADAAHSAAAPRNASDPQTPGGRRLAKVLPMLDELPLESVHAPEPAPHAFAGMPPIDLDGPPLVALVVDDGGYGGEATKKILGMQAPLTLAVLPFAPYSVRTAQQAAAKGFEVILHMPMEALDEAHTYPGSITTDMSQQQVAAVLKTALDDVPGAAGVNNHTGSLYTADSGAMDRFSRALAPTQLFFLDSGTTSGTVAFERAAQAGLAARRQDMFLDNRPERDYILGQADKLAAVARERGAAVGICHFRPATAEALPAVVGRIEAAGAVIVPLSRVMPEKPESSR